MSEQLKNAPFDLVIAQNDPNDNKKYSSINFVPGFTYGHITSVEEQKNLRDDVHGILMNNTTKRIKQFELLAFFHMAAGRGENTIALLDGAEVMERSLSCSQAAEYKEPKFRTAQESSHHKADYLNPWFEEIITSGADSVVSIWDENSNKWVVFHKLGRDGQDISAEELINEYEKLQKLLVMPKSGRLKIRWNLSATYLNGQEHNFPEYLLVDTKSLDIELFGRYYQHAVESGLIRNASTRIALIEAIMENDSNSRFGLFTPAHLENMRGDEWKNLIQMNSETLLKKIALHSVLSTVPLGIFLNPKYSHIFEKAVSEVERLGLVKSDETIQ